jgi:hypothetical protein
LPEVRSNKRWGEYRNYQGSVAIAGTYFVTTTQYLLSSIREWREDLIKDGFFDPQKTLSDSKLEVKVIKNWTSEFAVILKHLDPLEKWHLFIQYFKYSRRQKLQHNALLAQDLYEMAEILFLFLKDLGEDLSDEGIFDVLDWIDVSPRDQESKLPHWKERDYGKEVLNKPYQMSEFLCNEFEINPKPRAIIFTEGEEWKAIEKLFEFYGYNPSLLGIEFRSIKGEGVLAP